MVYSICHGADETNGESAMDYIYDSFVYAREADPSAKLTIMTIMKLMIGNEAIAQMAEELNENGLPIHEIMNQTVN